MDIITLICRDGEVKACKEELISTCEFFSIYYSINMDDNKKEIFIPFEKSIVNNFLNFINKNKELVDYSKLRSIRKYCGCDYNNVLDDYDSIISTVKYNDSSFANILYSVSKLFEKNQIDINNWNVVNEFLKQYIVGVNFKSIYDHCIKSKYDNNRIKSEIFGYNSYGYRNAIFNGKVLEIDQIVSEGIIEEYYNNNHNNPTIYLKNIMNTLNTNLELTNNNLENIKCKFDDIVNSLDQICNAYSANST